MEKKVTIINVKDQVLMRMLRSDAIELVASGQFKYTTKGKLKSFINREIKLYKTKKAIEGINFDDKDGKNKLVKDQFTGKTYAALFKKSKDLQITPDQNNINPMTGLPFTFTIPTPMMQLRVVAWP